MTAYWLAQGVGVIAFLIGLQKILERLFQTQPAF